MSVDFSARLPDEISIERVRLMAEEAISIRRLAAMTEDPEMRPRFRPEHDQALELWDGGGYAWYWKASQAGIPRPYWTATLVGQQTPATRAVRAFWDDQPADQGRALILLGPTGVGKTFAQVAGLRHSARGEIVFIPFGRLVRELLNPEAQGETLEAAIEAPVLCIDDLGGAYLKVDGLAEALVEELFVERELRRACTLATSNLRADRLGELLGDRVESRLAGPWASIVEVRGPDLRRARLQAVGQ